MKVSSIALLLLLISNYTFAQLGDNYIKLSEEITTETRKVAGFDKIDVTEDFEVFIHFSEAEEEVKIEANKNLHEKIIVEKTGSTLKISTAPYSANNAWGKHKGAKERLVAHITVSSLVGITADEDVIITLQDELISDYLEVDLSEDCVLEGVLNVDKLVVNLDEDSVLDIQGSAKTMDAKANEDSVIAGSGFVVDNLKIELNEDSEAKLTINNEIDLRANEDSNLYYHGDAIFIRKQLREDSKAKPW